MSVPADILKEPPEVAASALLARARYVEGRRSERILTQADANVFLSAVQHHPASRIRVFGSRGAFVPLKQAFRAMITLIEYTPADGYGPAQIAVTECDARRPNGKGPWLEVDGRKEL